MLKNTQILPKGTLDTIKRSRPIYTIGRKVRFAVGELLGSREVPGLTGRTHYNDFMLVSTDPAVVELASAGPTNLSIFSSARARRPAVTQARSAKCSKSVVVMAALFANCESACRRLACMCRT